MATQQTYYLNGPTLAEATSVFLDVGMTTCAPDGYYSDGTIARQQVGCVLLPAEACPLCGDGCVGNVVDLASGNAAYYIVFSAGSTVNDTGAIIVQIDSNSTVNGISALYDGVTYNELSSPVHGYLVGVAGSNRTYIGDTAADCGISGTPYVLNEFAANAPAYTYASLGSTLNVTPGASELALTAGDPGVCVMVIPKVNTTPDTLSVSIIGPCPGSNAIVSVSCPLKLPSFQGSYGVTTIVPEVFCLLPYSYTYYVAPVNGDGITLGLYDWVFLDENGVNKLLDGYYRSTNIPAPFDTFQIQNGVIVAFTTECAAYY